MHFSFATVSAVFLSLSAVGSSRGIGPLNERGFGAIETAFREGIHSEISTLLKQEHQSSFHLESKREPVSPPAHHITPAGRQHVQNHPTHQQKKEPSSHNSAGGLPQAQHQSHANAAARKTVLYKEAQENADRHGALAIQHANTGMHGQAAHHAAQASNHLNQVAHHRTEALQHHEAMGSGNRGHEHAIGVAEAHATGFRNMAAHHSAIHAQQQAAAAHNQHINLNSHNQFPPLGKRSGEDNE